MDRVFHSLLLGLDRAYLLLGLFWVLSLVFLPLLSLVHDSISRKGLRILISRHCLGK